MDEKIRHDRAEETQDERDGCQHEQGDQIPAVEVAPLAWGLGWLTQIQLLCERPFHRRRLWRLRPPWFCPMRYGKREPISHATASASLRGRAIVSSNIIRLRGAEEELEVIKKRLGTRMNRAGLSMSGFIIGATILLRRS